MQPEKKWQKKTAVNQLARLVESEFLALPEDKQTELVRHAQSIRDTIRAAATPDLGPAISRIGRGILRAAIGNAMSLKTLPDRVFDALKVLAPNAYGRINGGQNGN